MSFQKKKKNQNNALRNSRVQLSTLRNRFTTLSLLYTDGHAHATPPQDSIHGLSSFKIMPKSI